MANEMVVFESIAQSNLPRQTKSTLATMYDKMTGGGVSKWLGDQSVSVRRRFGGFQHGVIREGAESLATGAILGAISHGRAKGLDVGVGPVSIPMDAALGVAGLIASTMIKSGLAEDARAVGNSGLAVFAFRKGADLTQKLGFSASTPKSVVGGESDVDPIVAAARNL